MLTERCKSALGHSIGIALVAAMLCGLFILLDGPLGGRRAAAWVLGVYVAGGMCLGGIIARLSLVTHPPALWEQGDGLKLVRRLAFTFFYWPLMIPVGVALSISEALENLRRPSRRRTR